MINIIKPGTLVKFGMGTKAFQTIQQLNYYSFTTVNLFVGSMGMIITHEIMFHSMSEGRYDIYWFGQGFARGHYFPASYFKILNEK